MTGTDGIVSENNTEGRNIPGDPSGGEKGGYTEQPGITQYFTAEEIDALGEIGNICMGTSATTMYTLLGRKVTITTPEVAMLKPENVLASYKCPFLAISVEFVEGIHGRNLLILKDCDVALITDLLMGGEGKVDAEHVELTELHFSAMSELMNQMIGSSATAMSNMVDRPINISPPQVSRIEYYESVAGLLGSEKGLPVIKVSFDMEIEGLLKSKLLQVMTVDMARKLINLLMHPDEEAESEKAVMTFSQPEAERAERTVGPQANRETKANRVPPARSTRDDPAEKQRVKSVKQPSYLSFDEPAGNQRRSESQLNFDLINDIPLQVTVELGKTKKNIDDVLNLGIGSLVVLDKQAGDLVEVIVNGKRVARGEVVVIDENYGVRITEVIRP